MNSYKENQEDYRIKNERLQSLCLQVLYDLYKLGIKHGNPTFHINNKITTSWGICKGYTNINSSDNSFYKYEVDIWGNLLDERIKDESIKNTICHEIIHGIEGCYNHEEKFLEVIDYINTKSKDKTLGLSMEYNLQVNTSFNDVADIDVFIQISNHIVKCTKCNYYIGIERNTNIVKHPQNYYCPECESELIRIK